MNFRILPCLVAMAVAGPAAAIAASLNPTDLPAGVYTLDKKHASVTARVLHMGVSMYTMRFDTLDASFTYDPAHPGDARVKASVDATSLDVGAPYSRKFADEFLDASNHSAITFVSTAVTPSPDGRTGTMTGDLTLRGVTHPETFNVNFVGVGHGLFGGTITGFSAVTTIKRSDFGSTFLLNLVGDDVTIDIEAEFDRK
jgi:polyisoprenoid-binding protein YceI